MVQSFIHPFSRSSFCLHSGALNTKSTHWICCSFPQVSAFQLQSTQHWYEKELACYFHSRYQKLLITSGREKSTNVRVHLGRCFGKQSSLPPVIKWLHPLQLHAVAMVSFLHGTNASLCLYKLAPLNQASFFFKRLGKLEKPITWFSNEKRSFNRFWCEISMLLCYVPCSLLAMLAAL